VGFAAGEQGGMRESSYMLCELARQLEYGSLAISSPSKPRTFVHSYLTHMLYQTMRDYVSNAPGVVILYQHGIGEDPETSCPLLFVRKEPKDEAESPAHLIQHGFVFFISCLTQSTTTSRPFWNKENAFNNFSLLLEFTGWIKSNIRLLDDKWPTDLLTSWSDAANLVTANQIGLWFVNFCATTKTEGGDFVWTCYLKHRRTNTEYKFPKGVTGEI
jgi:hypothetical protein